MAAKRDNVKLNGTISRKLYESLCASADRRGWHVNDEIQWLLETFDRLQLDALIRSAFRCRSSFDERDAHHLDGSEQAALETINYPEDLRSIECAALVSVLEANLTPQAFQAVKNYYDEQNTDAIWSTINSALLFSGGFG